MTTIGKTSAKTKGKTHGKISNERVKKRNSENKRKKNGVDEAYIFSVSQLFNNDVDDGYMYSAEQLLDSESAKYLEGYVFSEFERVEWSRGTQYIPVGNEAVANGLRMSSMRLVSPEARIVFARLERAYYGYWINRIGCKYAGWNANLQSYTSDKCVGCRECQEQTYNRLTNIVPPVKYWNIVKVSLPLHHAVAVYEKGKRIQDGFVFDPWPEQTPKIYSFNDWPFTMRDLARREY